MHTTELNRTVFRQYDVRGIVGRDLTPHFAETLGRAYAALLRERGVAGPVAVGRDNRPSGDALRDGLVAGLTGCGVDIVDVGVVPTPLLYWTLHHEPVVGGIQITGSHNPPEYNGFKMCLGTGSLHGEAIQRLYELAVAGDFPSGDGAVRHADVVGRYVEDVVARTGTLSRPVRVVADYGNGAGAVVGPQLLERLGAQVTHLFAESDGRSPTTPRPDGRREPA
jgi:phosphomannomutase/phosphoglucomutase